MDMQYLPFYIIGGIAALIGLIIYLAYLFEKRRTQALRDFSMRRGFQFTEKEADLGDLREFKLFQQGHSKKLYNIMKTSRSGRPWQVSDYRYTVGGGKSSHTYKQTVAFVDIGSDRIPDFYLAPENIFHKIGDLFGYKDIDFEEEPEFSKMYLLKGPDEASIRKFFTSQRIKALQETDRITLEVSRGKVLYYRLNRRVKPEEMSDFITEVTLILELLNAGR